MKTKEELNALKEEVENSVSIKDSDLEKVAGGYWSKHYEDRYCSSCKCSTPHLIHVVLNDDGSGSITKQCNRCGLTTPD